MFALSRQALRLAVTRAEGPCQSLINKNLVASAWVGSYRIQDPDRYINRFPKPKRWPRYNEIVQPPQTDPHEERRPATYYHYRANIKYSPKKMWYIVKFIRGMSVDEAVKQLSFVEKKGAVIAKETLLEAQAIAVKNHNFEFKSNMWIEDAISVKGLVIKEGPPPKHYFSPPKDGNDLLKEYFDKLRARKIPLGI